MSGPVDSQTFLVNRELTDLDPPAAHEDCAPAAAVHSLPGGVAVGERQVLHGEPRMVLVLTMRRRPHLCLVAGIHVEDAALTAAAQGHLAAAIEYDLRAGVVDDLGGRLHHDGDRIGSAVERDDAASRDGAHHGCRRAARWRAAADHAGRIGRVDRIRLGRNHRAATGHTGRSGASRRRVPRCSGRGAAGDREQHDGDQRGQQRGVHGCKPDPNGRGKRDALAKVCALHHAGSGWHFVPCQNRLAHHRSVIDSTRHVSASTDHAAVRAATARAEVVLVVPATTLAPAPAAESGTSSPCRPRSRRSARRHACRRRSSARWRGPGRCPRQRASW
jgi:hypothetical protein